MNFEKILINNEQVQHLHSQTLEVLDKKGILFEHEGAIEIFKKHGFRVDNNVVFFSGEQVEAAIRQAPEIFEWETETGSVQVNRKEQSLLGPSAGPPYIFDKKAVRKSTLDDYIKIAKIVETSDVLTFTHLLLADTEDIRSEDRPYVQLATSLKYISKPINITSMQTAEESAFDVARNQIQMVKRFYGKTGNVVVGGACPTSPLAYGETDVNVLLGYLAENQPVMIMSCSLPVLTSPASLAGTIIQNNAEILAGIVLTQLVKPGIPVIYANTSSSTNLRNVTLALGAPETALITVATAALAKYYELPYRSGGCLSDALDVDYQAGMESAYCSSTAIYSDVDVMQFACGLMGSFNITSVEKYIVDEQNLRFALRVKEGINIREETSYINEILKVEHRGNYLSGRTPKEYKREHLAMDVFNKVDYNTWKEKNGKTIFENAAERVEERVENYVQRDLAKAQIEILTPYLKV
ncbi:trimethylamine methyltransferase family protein [Eubacterium callanderi]|uniref:trimethylamine methyltransferase family protein n=1 Tax=Eubacterium callanderi TaxID=53442 RepID=UPI001C2DB7BA|nr:trimethylamine methyltransferase family protein [Eubacterium callanderi]MBV1684107.1 trimethylamine methyltransferase family protein [Eubacterium callanderi]WPK69221.1 Glycine betaine methyltransferase [Eubacterium callanderi]WPK73519.1 Glycine betaine methyltransferase [Eubacterium callanderi]